jgi:hypothetical protein
MGELCPFVNRQLKSPGAICVSNDFGPSPLIATAMLNGNTEILGEENQT